MTGTQATLERALAVAARAAPATGTETVEVARLAGRRLAQDVVAVRDLPPAAVSAMDGWAVRAADTPGLLRAAGESAAGAPGHRPLGAGEAMAISTGALLPPGADAVARREVTAAQGAMVRVAQAVAPGRDVRPGGELIRAGGVLLRAGHRVRAHEVGAVGAVGLARVECARRPRVAVLATGAELVPLGADARPHEVHDSSRVGVAAQLAAAGAVVVAEGTVGDELGATVAALREMLAVADVVATCGGISAGEHDLVRAALAAIGAEEVLRGIEAAPVRPTVIARHGPRVVLGLPGNPASAAIAAHLLGRPLLGAPAGWRRAPLARDADGHPSRPSLLRCTEGTEGVAPLPHQGAHAITSLAGADVVAVVPVGGARAGAPVAVSPLP